MSQAEFRGLYRDHYAFVWHTVRRFGVPSTFVEDAVQDTFVTAYRRRGDFDGRSPRAWLYAIGRRVASNHRRGRRRLDQRHRDAAMLMPPRASRADDAALALRTLDRFFARLCPEDRELFVLSEVEGLTGPELAEATQRKLATVYSRMRTLRERFAAHVDGDDEAVLQRARADRPRATAAGWALLLPRLGDTTAATAATAAGGGLLEAGAMSWLTTKAGGWVLGAALGALVLTGVGVVSRVVRDRPDEASAPAPVHTQSPTPQAPPAQKIESARAPAPGSPAAPDELTAARPLPEPKLTEATRSPLQPTQPRPTDDAHLPSTPPPNLSADTRLLRDASKALRDSKANAALVLLDRHRERFTSSPQADLRAALRVEALCALDREAEARSEAEALLDIRPTTPVADRISRSCAGAR